MPQVITIDVQPTGPNGPAVTHFKCSVKLEGRVWFFAFYTVTGATEYAQTTPIQPEPGEGEAALPSSVGWFFDLSPVPPDPVTGAGSVLRGIALACGLDLLFPYRHLDVPPGPLFVQDLDAVGADPDAKGFSDKRFALVYVDYSGV